MSGKSLARRRAEEAMRQGGKCHWCQRAMTPIPENAHLGVPKPDTMVTLDHLFPRGHPRRLHLRPGEPRYVAACLRCNQRRGLINSMLRNEERGFTKTTQFITAGRAEPWRVD